MIPLTVHHRTVYPYRQSVDLWPHRLMLCPRESRDLQVISCGVTVLPTARTTWAHDVFGNAVATAVFQGASDSLVIDSVVELRLEATAWPIFNIAASAITYPFRYSDDEWTDLGALTRQQYPDAGGRLAAWARAFVCGDRTDTLALLKDLSDGVSEALRYHSRDDEGIQSPIETLARGWAPAGISRSSLSKRMLDRRTRGAKSSCRAPGGSASIRRTEASAARISFLSLWLATSDRRRPSSAPMPEAATLSRACRSRSS